VTEEQEWGCTWIDDAPGIVEMGQWLQYLGSAEVLHPVGIAVRENRIAFATRETGMAADERSLPLEMRPVLLDMLKRVLIGRNAPLLASRDILQDLQGLSEWLNLEHEELVELVKAFHYDLTALSHVGGQYIFSYGEKDVVTDALDNVVVGPQMAITAPPYYKAVSLPLIRHQVASTPLKANEPPRFRVDQNWTVTYDHLLLRVAAHLSADPTLVKLFRDEEEEPFHAFGSRLRLELDEAWAFLVWLCCGEDSHTMEKYHPGLEAKLPTNPPLVKADHLSRQFPVFALALANLRETFLQTHTAKTVYARQSTYGLPFPELFHFVFFGNVRDILEVAMVSIANALHTRHWLLGSEEHHGRRAIISGLRSSEQEIGLMQHQLTQVSGLNEPLMRGRGGMVPLSQKVSVQ
jgi:hypothetical protein